MARLHCKQKAATKAVPAGNRDPPRNRRSSKRAAAAITKSRRAKKTSSKATESKSNPKPKRKSTQSPSGVDPADTGPGFRFLDLIPEIRNLIYEFALQRDGAILVEDLTLPPLLASCTQIRDEACSIWYRDNQFRAEVYDCDATALNQWSRHCCTVGQRDYFDVTIVLGGDIYWGNLLHWCRAIWIDDKARILVYESDMDEDYRIVCEAHQIAMHHKGKPWSKCLRALEDFRIEEEASGNGAWFEDDSDDDE